LSIISFDSTNARNRSSSPRRSKVHLWCNYYPSPVIIYRSPVIIYRSPVIIYRSPAIIYRSSAIIIDRSATPIEPTTY